jgi:hypothetical protein
LNGISIQGVCTTTCNHSGKFPVGSSNLWIGARSGGANNFNGSIDDVMIFNRSLSADEIAALYANTSSKYLGVNYTDLQSRNYTFKAYSQDTTGNVNQTETREISVHLPPVLTLTKNVTELEHGVGSIALSWLAEQVQPEVDAIIFNVTYPNGTLLFSSSDSGSIDLTPENLTIPGIYRLSLWANDSSGKTASQTDSFSVYKLEITNCVELQAMNAKLDGNYILMNDINCSDTVNWNGGEGFEPVGNSTSGFRFTGSFDGQNYRIINLFINRSSTNYNGLFGYTENSAEISNLHFDDAYIRGGGWYTGAFVGYGRIKIYNSSVSGSVIGGWRTGGLVGYIVGSCIIYNSSSSAQVSGSNDVGGLIGNGDAEGTVISHSYATGNVIATGDQVGGFMGNVRRLAIRNSYATGNVLGTHSVGGFVGRIYQTVNINASYATGNVHGTGNHVGGFLGTDATGDYNSLRIYNSYASGNVSSAGTLSGHDGDNVGGFIGRLLHNDTKIYNSYSTGTATGGTGATNVGGFAGLNTVSAEIFDSFWDTQTSGSTTSAGNATGKTTAELKSILTFNDTATVGLDTPWDIALIGEHTTETWYIDNGNDYPRLGWEEKSEEDTTAPTISVLSPLNQTYSSSTIWFNATANEAVDTWIVNYNGTNVTLASINTSLEVEDGSYQLLLYANDTSGNWGLNDSVWFGVESGAEVTVCRELNAPNAVYTLQNDVFSVGTCFNILANNVTLDCGGHMINYSTGGVLGYGVNVSGYNWTTVRNCVVNEGVGETSFKHGIRLNEANDGNIINNSISTIGGAADGISLWLSSNNSIINNSISTEGSASTGIYFSSSSGSFVLNNFILTEGNMGHGIYFELDTNNNSFIGMNVSTSYSNTYAVYVYGTTHNFTMNDSVLGSVDFSDFYRSGEGDGGEWNLTNVSRMGGEGIDATFEPGANGTLNYGWWIDANVTNASNGGALEGASVIVRDKDSVVRGSELTDASGRARLSALEYTRSGANGATWVWYSNYSLNVSKEGYTDEVRSYNLTIEGNVWADVEMGEADATPPIITVLSPLNQTYTNSTIWFNVTADEEIDTWIVNYNGTNITLGAINTSLEVEDGNYQLLLYANDTSGNWGLNDSVWFGVETVLPQIEFVSPTPPNATVTSNTSAVVNVSIYDENLNEVKWNWNGTEYVVFNDSVKLLLNFNNNSLIGENSSYAVDSSGHGYNATFYGNSAWTSSGRFNSGVSFDGSASYLLVNDSDYWDFASRRGTISFWMRPSDISAVRGIISQVNNDQNWAVYIYTDGRLAIGRAGVNEMSSSTGTIATNNWYHVVIVSDSTTNSNTRVYVNGEQKISGSTAVWTSTANPLKIGGYVYASTNYYFSGIIDEFQVLNRTLSVDEINQTYMTSLSKHNSSQWYLYINQTKNATAPLSLGTYTYQASASNNIGTNSTEERILNLAEQGILINRIYPLSNIEINNSELFNITLNVSCPAGMFCGQANISGYYADASIVEDYVEVVFNTTGSVNWTVPEEVSEIDVLVVGGGGGAGKGDSGSDYNPGGGGAGGLVFIEDYSVVAGEEILVIVGSGGSGSSSTSTPGINGGNSSFGDLVALGGGGGGSMNSRDGNAGGSGGGAGNALGSGGTGGSGLQPSLAGDSGTYGYGNSGASSLPGGGGGAGSASSSATGGSGMLVWGATYSTGGSANSDGLSGSSNSGNGGNGPSRYSNEDGGSGGSGVVIIRYPKYKLVPTSGQTLTTNSTSNPITINLESGQSEIVNFWIEAVGDSGTYSFYEKAEYTDYPSIYNVTEEFNVTIVSFPPTISVISPTNTTYTTSTIYFNATADKETDTWILNYNGTNVTLGAINTSLEVEDGSYQLLLYANDTSGNWGVNDSVWFSVQTPPALTITKNVSSFEYNTSSINITWLAEHHARAVDTVKFNVTYPNGTLLYSSSSESGEVVLDSSDLVIPGIYRINLWANCSAGKEDLATDSFSVYKLNITNCVELQGMNAKLDGNYTLMNDINCSDTVNWNGGEGFEPVGDNDNRFTGSFDGQNYTISGLFIRRPSTNNVGLFGYVESSHFVRNLSVLNANITGYDYVGIFGGRVDGVDYGESRLEVAHIETSGSITAYRYAGGISGYSWKLNSATGLKSTLTIIGTHDWSGYFGGLFGRGHDGFPLSYSNAYVNISRGGLIGGLVGELGTGSISECFASGTVLATERRVGGLIGRATFLGLINSSYSAVDITSTHDEVGGLIGYLSFNDGARVVNSHSFGIVAGNTDVGGLIGLKSSEGILVLNSFWDINTSGQNESDGGTGKTTAELKSILTFNDTVTVGLDEAWDIALIGEHTTETWYIDNGNDYPRLGWEEKSEEDTTPPVISVASPLNQTYTNSTIYFNATADEEIDTWIVNYNGTNITLGAINTSLEVEDGNYQLLLYANDTSGNWGVNDSVWFGVDTYVNSPPQITNARVNAVSPVEIDSEVKINATVTDTDGNLQKVILQVVPPVSAVYNVTPTGNGGEYYYNVVLSEVGSWQFKFYANDSLGEKVGPVVAEDLNGNNQIGVERYGRLVLSQISPAGSSNQPQNQTFNSRVNVTCDGESGAVCGLVSATIRYNSSGFMPDTNLPTSSSSPFYVTGTNPYNCGVMSRGDVCVVEFSVNATGEIGRRYNLDVSAISNVSSISSNITDYFTLKVVYPILSIVISNELANIDFGASLNPGTQNNPAINNTNDAYNAQCNHPGGFCNLSIRGEAPLKSGINVLDYGNVSWGVINDAGFKNSLSNYLTVLNSTLPHLAVQKIYFWVDIPSHLVAGDYRGNFTLYAESV